MNLKSQNIKEYLGDIDFYLNQRKIEDFREIEKKDKVISVKKNKNIDMLQYNNQALLLY